MTQGVDTFVSFRLRSVAGQQQDASGVERQHLSVEYFIQNDVRKIYKGLNFILMDRDRICDGAASVNDEY